MRSRAYPCQTSSRFGRCSATHCRSRNGSYRVIPYMVAAFVVPVFFADHPSWGQSREFPYDAVVDAPEVYVRSGPGEDFYPTTKLKRGDKVHVHRHDPGGWYMIAPPPGSFSWIAARYVRRTGQTAGELSEDFVSVWVGSEFGDESSVFQRRLSRGEEIVVTGRKEMRRHNGTERMLRIRPPRNEWRWIPGHTVFESGLLASRSDPRARDEFTATESTTNSDPTDSTSRDSSRRLFKDLEPRDRNSPAKKHSDAQINSVASERLRSDRERLKQLDVRFRAIIRSETSDWDFDQLEQDYRELQRHTEHSALAGQVALRVPAIERYKRIKREYDGFVSLTRETDRRDAELLRKRSPGGSSAPAMPPGSRIDARPSPFPDSLSRQGHEPTGVRAPSPARQRFVGAGVVQRSVAVPNALPFALIAPPNRILAYLKPELGISLEDYVGRPYGIEGERAYDEKVGTDVIMVRKLVPIHLKSR